MSTLKRLGAASAAILKTLIAPQVGRDALADSIGYVTNAGVPSAVVPEFIGQHLFDTTNSSWYKAYGVAAGEWVAQGDNTLSAAELAFLDGATAGTQVASKAVIADANVNTGVSKVTALHIGASGSETQVTATGAELNYNDIATLGTGAASKALVLDANETVLLPAPLRYDVNTTITAFATGGQASATALTGEYNDVTTCATAGDSVKLPSAVGGESIVVKNSGAASLAVFPATSDSINALAVNLSVNIPVGGTLRFFAKSATVWETNEAIVLPAPTTQSGELVVKAADNAADYEIIVTNASHGQATTHTIPDPGGAAASFVLTEGTQTINGAKTISNLSSFATAVEAAEHGAGAIGTSSFGAPQTYRWIENGVIVTQTKFDLTGLASGGTANDVVGLAAGGAAYIGRNVVATNGVIFKMELSCLETPAGGDGDIDIVADTSAALIGDGAYTGAIKINGGTLVIGQTVQNLVPAVDANFYFYIAAVGAGGGTYTAGMFVLTTYGHAVLA